MNTMEYYIFYKHMHHDGKWYRLKAPGESKADLIIVIRDLITRGFRTENIMVIHGESLHIDHEVTLGDGAKP